MIKIEKDKTKPVWIFMFKKKESFNIKSTPMQNQNLVFSLLKG